MIGQLEVFVEVARLGSVGRAGEALELTQPAATWRLQALERELGIALFDRTGRGMRLTAAGRATLPYAERAVRATREMRGVVQAVQRGASGRLDVGCSPAIGVYLLPEALLRFRARRPNVEVAVRTGHSEEVLRLVLDGEARVGLVRTLRHPDISTCQIAEDDLVLAAHPDHPFASRGHASAGEVGAEGLILFDRASSFYELTQSLFARAGVLPRIAMELDSAEGAKMMVAKGLGIAILPAMAIVRDLAEGRLVRVQIDDADVIRRKIYAIWRTDEPPTEIVSEFIDSFGGSDE
ncbi:MAG: LysR family transcriptional regulator [Chloroflexota bacterium]|nr:MAG: LysR family transcriptional regulator [Chloroflexota bacterium]